MDDLVVMNIFDFLVDIFLQPKTKDVLHDQFFYFVVELVMALTFLIIFGCHLVQVLF